MWSKLSLRLRLTLMTGAVLASICLMMTVVSVRGAQEAYASPIHYLTQVATSVTDYSIAEERDSTYEHAMVSINASLVEFEEPTLVIESEPALTSTAVDPAKLEAVAVVPAQQLFLNVDQAVQGRYEQSADNFRLLSVLFACLFVAGGMLLVWFAAGRALAPVRILSEQMESIDASTLSARLPAPRSLDELARLTHSFNRMLEKLDGAFESQKRFAHNAAHELKTPVASILTTLDVLELDEHPGEQDYREAVRVARKNAERMGALIKDLLSLNACTDERGMRQVPLRALMEELLAEHAEAAERKGVRPSVNGDAWVFGHRALLARAFGNLIQNAVRYNAEGGALEIRLSPGRAVVSDEGMGIPEDQLEAVFEPFYCVDASRSRALGGSGLGLSIARQIFVRHDMRVSAQRRVDGPGTRLIVEWALPKQRGNLTGFKDHD